MINFTQCNIRIQKPEDIEKGFLATALLCHEDDANYIGPFGIFRSEEGTLVIHGPHIHMDDKPEPIPVFGGKYLIFLDDAVRRGWKLLLESLSDREPESGKIYTISPEGITESTLE